MAELDWLQSADTTTKSEQTGERRAAQYLVILVSGMELGVSLDRVSEIVPYAGVSSVPGTPDFVRGVVHLRARMIPVIDLAARLGRDACPVSKRTCILMLEPDCDGSRVHIGLAVDGVSTLLDVERAQIQPAPRFGAGVEVRHLEGLLAREGGLLPLIDVDRMFAADQLSRALEVVEHEVPP